MLVNALHRGVVTDWNAAEAVWRHAFEAVVGPSALGEHSAVAFKTQARGAGADAGCRLAPVASTPLGHCTWAPWAAPTLQEGVNGMLRKLLLLKSL